MYAFNFVVHLAKQPNKMAKILGAHVAFFTTIQYCPFRGRNEQFDCASLPNEVADDNRRQSRRNKI